jgi:glycosyltransferase involved in cell wall biosynthesis
VNLQEYPQVKLAGNQDILAGNLRFVLVSRLLISKGVRVFAEAARLVKKMYPSAQFHLVGPFDPNPNRVDETEVAAWVAEGTLTHHGMVRDIPGILKTMHVFCLPTWYREGVPHATLEALSSGLPIITTDSVGARECVTGPFIQDGHFKRGENGFLCPTQDVLAVTAAMEYLIQNPALVPLMGQASRKLAEEVFDVRLVDQIILRAMNLLPSEERHDVVSAPCPMLKSA